MSCLTPGCGSSTHPENAVRRTTPGNDLVSSVNAKNSRVRSCLHVRIGLCLYKLLDFGTIWETASLLLHLSSCSHYWRACFYIMWWVASLAKQHLSAVHAKLWWDWRTYRRTNYGAVVQTSWCERKYSKGRCAQTFQFQPGLNGGWRKLLQRVFQPIKCIERDDTPRLRVACHLFSFAASQRRGADIGSSVKTPNNIGQQTDGRFLDVYYFGF